MFLFVFWIINFVRCSANFSYSQKCSLTSKRLRITGLIHRARLWGTAMQLIERKYFHQALCHRPLCLFIAVVAARVRNSRCNRTKVREIAAHTSLPPNQRWIEDDSSGQWHSSAVIELECLWKCGSSSRERESVYARRPSNSADSFPRDWKFTYNTLYVKFEYWRIGS